jgi:hypothetical protein
MEYLNKNYLSSIFDNFGCNIPPIKGARVHKATEMSPFLLTIRELGVLHHFCFNNLLFASSGVPNE